MSRYIDAERLKQILKPIEWGTPDERWIPEHEIGAMLDYFPAADVVEVRHGRWEYKEEHKGSKYGYYYCSICGMASWASNSPYCPNCGAKMDEVTE